MPEIKVNLSKETYHAGEELSGVVDVSFPNKYRDVKHIKVELIGVSETWISLPVLNSNRTWNDIERHRVLYDSVVPFIMDPKASGALRGDFSAGDSLSLDFKFQLPPISVCGDRAEKFSSKTQWASIQHEKRFDGASKGSLSFTSASSMRHIPHNPLPPTFKVSHEKTKALVEYYVLVTIKSYSEAPRFYEKKFPVHMGNPVHDCEVEKVWHVSPAWLKWYDEVRLNPMVASLSLEDKKKTPVKTYMSPIDTDRRCHIAVQSPKSVRPGQKVHLKVFFLSNEPGDEFRASMSEKGPRGNGKGVVSLKRISVSWSEKTTLYEVLKEVETLTKPCYYCKNSGNQSSAPKDYIKERVFLSPKKHDLYHDGEIDQEIDLAQLEHTSNVDQALYKEFPDHYAMDISHLFQEIEIPEDAQPEVHACQFSHTYEAKLLLNLCDRNNEFRNVAFVLWPGCSCTPRRIKLE